MFRLKNIKIFLIYISVLYTLKVTSKSQSYNNQLSHSTDILTDLNLLKAVSKWFSINEIKLLFINEKDLSNKFMNFINKNKIWFKSTKELKKAFVYLKNIQKRKEFLLTKCPLSLKPNRSHKTKNLPFKYGK